MTTLTFRNITKTYSGNYHVQALREVSTEICQGDYVVIEGPSGSGKSTFLNVLALLDVASSGEYLIDGKNVTTLSDKERARLRSETFSFVFQSFHLIPSRTVLDNAMLGLTYRAVSDEEARARASASLRFVGLEQKAGFRASQLSGGESQRVAIARAIATGAPILIADEPTGNLDSGNSRKILELLDELHAQGKTIVIVTHDQEVAEHALRRLSILDGIMTEEDPPARFVEQTFSDSFFMGKPSKVRVRSFFRDAATSVFASATRSAGLITMVMLGVAVMLTTMGLAQTARYQVTDAFDTNANRRVSMFVSGDNTKEAVKKLIADSGQETINRIQGVPGVEAAVLLTEYPDIEVKTRPNDEPREARFYGVFPTELSPALFDIDRHGMAEHKLAENEVLVGKDFARALDLGPMIAAPTIWLQGQPFTVVGEVINSGMRSEIPNGVIVSEKAASAMAVPSSVGIELRTQPGAAQQVAQYAPLAWNATYIDDISVYAPPNPNDMRDTIDQSVNTVLMTLTLVSALAALLTLTNSMATGVQRRTGEFGMRRAIGCQKSHLAGLVAAESTIIGAIGGIIGTVIAILTILVVTMFQRWQPVMDFSLVPYGIVGGVLVGVLGSLLAIYRAVRITPAEALRSH